MKIAFLYTDESQLSIPSPMEGPVDYFLCNDFTPDMAMNFTHIVTPNMRNNNDFLARLGAQIQRQPITNIQRISDPHHFVQPVFSGTVLRTVFSQLYPILLSFDAPIAKDNHSRQLHDARIVVGGGKGLQNAENFKLVEDLAEAIGGTYGATLDVIQAGWADSDTQIGQTGTSIAPQLYLACGISGAAHHVAGIRRAKTVVAINTNPNAAIFQHADYGFVGDVLQILPRLIACFKSKST